MTALNGRTIGGEKGGRGDSLARWIDENLDYGSVYFFPTLWAVNVQWHEKPERRVDSYAVPKGRWR